MAIGKYEGTVTDIEYLSDSVIVLSLDVPQEFTFTAGQFVIFQFEEDGKKHPKSYSIYNAPSEKGVLQSCIKLIDGGYASERFKKMKTGEKIPFRGPLGGLKFDSSNKNHFFICTGTGITPFCSIFKEHLESHPDCQFTLLFGTRFEKDIVLRKEFSKMEQEFDNFTYLVTLSREDWDGLKGRVMEHLPASVEGTSFYICGLKDMVLDTRQKLFDQGVDAQHIKIERYS